MIRGEIRNGHNIGWVEVICGCMFSGKTEELIRRIRRAQIAKQRICVFQHGLDVRFGEQRIASHSGGRLDAMTVQSSEEIRSLVGPEAEVVAVDEAQFFDDGLVTVTQELADRGLRVMLAGLDTDFRGEPFGPMPALMAVADAVDKLQAICMVCGRPATRTQRLINGKPAFYEDDIIMVGAADMYEARCRGCHLVPRRNPHAQ